MAAWVAMVLGAAGGVVVGIILMGALTAGKDADAWNDGYMAGRNAQKTDR